MTKLQKVFLVGLVLVIFVWGGVGVYYFRLIRPAKTSDVLPLPFPLQPAKPSVVKEVFEDLDETHLIIGEFQGWEEIEGSDDRYILLTNPETKRSYPKIKVVLDFSNAYESYNFWDGITVFIVEKTEEEYDDLGYLTDFTSEEIDKLIKKGDLVKVVFEKEAIIEKLERNAEDLEIEDLESKTADYLALSLSIKNAEGKTAVEKELGREI